MVQDDTFFRCESGRLKLRTLAPDKGELIFYLRANKNGPKESAYVLSPTKNPETLLQLLSLAYGEVGRVRKHRTLYHIGRTRVHLDKVEGLGHFMELEVVLKDNEPSEIGLREAHDIMSMLDIKKTQLVDVAYVDLLAEKKGTQ